MCCGFLFSFEPLFFGPESCLMRAPLRLRPPPPLCVPPPPPPLRVPEMTRGFLSRDDVFF
eukprot:EC812976.1.p4 GENE.EC812976.1~~EC812976.1.p4  ORF type:complete len:60 (-),score=2.31 EC812976.1:153-332(-)